MSDLFDQQLAKNISSQAPLADRLRPQRLEDFVGQQQLVGAGTLLRQPV